MFNKKLSYLVLRDVHDVLLGVNDRGALFQSKTDVLLQDFGADGLYSYRVPGFFNKLLVLRKLVKSTPCNVLHHSCAADDFLFFE